MGINLYTDFGINNISFKSDKSQVRQQKFQTSPDCFVKESKEVYYNKRLEQLFPNGELDATYDKMCDELELDYKPKLNLVVPLNGNAGGGYSFFNNSIMLSLEDTIGSDTKIYEIKDGKKQLEISNSGMPIMTNKLIASYIAQHPMSAKNRGVDKIVTEPASDEEIKKLFLLKLHHELIHAKQHMIMRQTEGIGAKEIILSWNQSPQNSNKAKIDKLLEGFYLNSYWKDKATFVKYTKDSEQGIYAYKCLDAIKNYAPVESEEYNKNFIETEAYKLSNDYITQHYGEWV